MKKLFRSALMLLLIAALLITPFTQAYADGLPFVDIKVGSWYYDALCWAYENNYVSGVDATHFGPNKPCTRAQIVTILYGLAGKPEVAIENPFDDIAPKNYYYNAVLWAYENGITSGKTPTTFVPNGTCTRAEAVTFIWAYFGRQIVAPEVQFSDVPNNAYFYNAVNWAFSNGVTAGTEWNLFSPKTTVTRAMVVVFLRAQKHVLEGGTHDFQYVEDVPISCTAPEGRRYACECGNKKIVYTGTEVLGHDFCKAKLISDATAKKATVYQLTCVRCGKADSVGNRSLGKPIFAQPNIQSNLPTHVWTQDELQNGIHLSSTDGAEATVTRKWFGNAWCYIAHIVLPKGAYGHFTGVNVYALTGRNNMDDYRSGYQQLVNTPEAKLLVTGDTRLLNDKATLRGGVGYKDGISSGFSCWSSITGQFGQIKNIVGKTGNLSPSELTAAKVTDALCFGLPYIEDGRMDMEIFASELDYDASTYKQQNLRRQVSGMGLRREGDTVHIYLVACDGSTYTNKDSSDPYNFANDRASYGNSKRELMILMSTLGVDYEINLDGGWSVCMNIRNPDGSVEQLNAADFSLKTGYSPWPARELWDFLYFK